MSVRAVGLSGCECVVHGCVGVCVQVSGIDDEYESDRKTVYACVCALNVNELCKRRVCVCV